MLSYGEYRPSLQPEGSRRTRVFYLMVDGDFPPGKPEGHRQEPLFHPSLYLAIFVSPTLQTSSASLPVLANP